MREPVVGLLDRADMAIGAASGVVEEGVLETLATAARRVRARLDLGDDVLIVGLAGGTGSGKSSLLNAIAGEELAQVGAVRPTTAEPLAVTSRELLPRVEPFLRSLGVGSVASADMTGRLCLVDLPDIDSVETGHREQVDEVLGALDVVAWVVDPEKYSDRVIHDIYVRPLAANGGRFVFVLNQSDRLDPVSRERVVSHLTSSVSADGVEDPVVVATAAAPPAGPPEGLAALLDSLARVGEGGAVARALTDLEGAAGRLLDELGGGLHFERRAGEAVAGTAALVRSGRLDEATDAMLGFLEDVAAESRGLSAVRVRQLAPDVPAAVSDAHAVLEEAGDGVTRELEARCIRPVREVMRQRAEAAAAAVDLALAVEAARSGPGV